jgi:hypothetical protein
LSVILSHGDDRAILTHPGSIAACGMRAISPPGPRPPSPPGQLFARRLRADIPNFLTTLTAIT